VAKYRSGEAVVEFTQLKLIGNRRFLEFEVTIDGEDDCILSTDEYDCPSSWSDEQIAIDMLGWAMVEDDEVLLAIELNEFITNEDVPVVQKVQ
jgi:hypothetical protein